MRIRWRVVYAWPEGGEKFSATMRLFDALNYVRIFPDATHLQLVFYGRGYSPARALWRIPRRFIWRKMKRETE